MAKPLSPVSITQQDLQTLQAEQTDHFEVRKRLQRFLDATNCNLDLDQVSPQYLEKISAVVEDPVAALAGPNILLWNNICRQRLGL